VSRPTALITGASSGIGAATARLLAAVGYDLVAVARRGDRLDELGAELAPLSARVEGVVADLSDHAGLERVARRAGEGDIDLLVSNAGVSAYGPFADLDPALLERAWTLNADATPVLFRAALPGMLERGDGGLIAVASNLAFSAGVAPAVGTHDENETAPRRSLPERALYVGAKAGMVAFTRVLASELAGTGVRAMVVCPGLVSSEWNGGASQGPLSMTPEDVAQATWSGFSRGEIVCLPGLDQPDLLQRFEDSERVIMRKNLGSQMAERYRTPIA
jgi:short-subunit dehydrogenase